MTLTKFSETATTSATARTRSTAFASLSTALFRVSIILPAKGVLSCKLHRPSVRLRRRERALFFQPLCRSGQGVVVRLHGRIRLHQTRERGPDLFEIAFRFLVG